MPSVVEQPLHGAFTAYQSDSEPLEKAVESVTWSAGEVVLCRDKQCGPSESPSTSSWSVRLTLSVEREELKLESVCPFRFRGRLLI